MHMDAWLPLYRQICAEFGYSEDSDRASAILLSELLGTEETNPSGLARAKVPRDTVVCGDGASLSDDIDSVSPQEFVVAADGATSVLAQRGIVPAMIVTDLDGLVSDQVEANRAGAVSFVHAHGDNVSALRQHARSFQEPVVGTCQCAPVKGLFNAGGFTDGDRAVCICQELGAEVVYLAGFDFESPRKKRGRDPAIKRRKLAWARKIIGELEADGLQVMVL